MALSGAIFFMEEIMAIIEIGKMEIDTGSIESLNKSIDNFRKLIDVCKECKTDLLKEIKRAKKES